MYFSNKAAKLILISFKFQIYQYQAKGVLDVYLYKLNFAFFAELYNWRKKLIIIM